MELRPMTATDPTPTPERPEQGEAVRLLRLVQKEQWRYSLGYSYRDNERDPWEDVAAFLDALATPPPVPAAADPLSVQEADMCPNCVTPWKCNGPHADLFEWTKQALLDTGFSIPIDGKAVRRLADRIEAALATLPHVPAAHRPSCSLLLDGVVCSCDQYAPPVPAAPGLDEKHESWLREFLWWNHGHRGTALYGDDGELQCKACGHWDYRRDPLPILIEQAQSHAVIRDLQAASARLSPDQKEDT